MPDECTLDVTPLTWRTGLTLYYNDEGECFDGPTSTTIVDAVYREVSGADSTPIAFYPKDEATEEADLDYFCGAGNSATTYASSSGGGSPTLTLTFAAPGTQDVTWGWDFGQKEQPPRLRIKVRVKRI